MTANKSDQSETEIEAKRKFLPYMPCFKVDKSQSEESLPAISQTRSSKSPNMLEREAPGLFVELKQLQRRK